MSDPNLQNPTFLAVAAVAFLALGLGGIALLVVMRHDRKTQATHAMYGSLYARAAQLGMRL